MKPSRVIILCALFSMLSACYCFGEEVLLAENVEIDDYQINPKDFKKEDNTKPKSLTTSTETVVVVCSGTECKLK